MTTTLFPTMPTLHRDATVVPDEYGINWPHVTNPGHDWEADAKCNGADPARWDLRPNRTWAVKEREAARACFGCPVVRECAQSALHYQDREIVRAGIPIPGWAPGGDIRATIRELSRRAGVGRGEVAA